MTIVTRRRLAFAAWSLGLALAAPALADLNDLLQMSEQLDRIEKQDFGDAIDKANACTRARDFVCTDSWLAKAARLAGGSGDRQRLAAAQQGLANEKARVAEEERQRAEEQRRIAEAEERLRVAEAEAARRASAASEPSTTMQLLQMGTAILGAVAAEKARMAALASSRPSSGGLPLADLSSERRAIEKARADAAAAQAARNQANAARLAHANRSAPAPQPTQLASSAYRTAPAASGAAASYQAPPVYTSTERTSCPPGMSAVPSATGTACVVSSSSGTAKPASAPPEMPKYQPQVVIIPTGPTSCPPGSSPARHSNGQTIAVPAAAYCIKDPVASGSAAAQVSGGAAPRTAPSPGASAADKTVIAKSEGGSPPPTPKTKRIEWGPLQKEALAVCHQGKNGKWRCDGPVQMELFHDGPTLEAALRGQQCAGGTMMAGGPVIEGEQWTAYRCNHAIGYGDRDIGARYGLVAMQRSFMCPKHQLGDGRCTTFYDGQDQR